GTISNFFLKASDLFLVLISLGVVIVLRYSPAQNPAFVVDYLSQRVKVTNAILGALLIFSWHVTFGAQGLYVSHRLISPKTELKEIARAIGISSVALLVTAQLGRWPTINLATVAEFAVIGFVTIAGVRLALRFNLRRLRTRGHNVKTLIIVGGGE